MQSFRKPPTSSLYGSPPTTSGFFPHDLDDIYEVQDHQYFTHTGASNTRAQERPTINSIFHRVGAAPASFDDYSVAAGAQYSLDGGMGFGGRHRFDNSGFAKSLSINDDENGSPSPTEHKHKHHHNHSIQEMLRHFGKKVHIWPRKSHDSNSVCTSPQNDPQENFRTRSKSLDVNTLSRRTNRILEDCGATYKIYEKIVKEGKTKARPKATKKTGERFLQVIFQNLWYLL